MKKILVWFYLSRLSISLPESLLSANSCQFYQFLFVTNLFTIIDYFSYKLVQAHIETCKVCCSVAIWFVYVAGAEASEWGGCV